MRGMVLVGGRELDISIWNTTRVNRALTDNVIFSPLLAGNKNTHIAKNRMSNSFDKGATGF